VHLILGHLQNSREKGRFPESGLSDHGGGQVAPSVKRILVKEIGCWKERPLYTRSKHPRGGEGEERRGAGEDENGEGGKKGARRVGGWGEKVEVE